MVVGGGSLSFLHPQEVSILTLLVPGIDIIVRADGKSKLSHTFACIFVTARFLHTQDVLVVLVPGRGNRGRDLSVKNIVKGNENDRYQIQNHI